MKKPDLTPYLPLGEDGLARTWRKTVGWSLFFGLVGEISYWFQYVDQRQWLFDDQGKLVEGMKMVPFGQLIPFTLGAMGAALLLQLMLIPMFYAAFYRGSKSIYLMRRLPQRWERWRRTATLPLCSAATTLVLFGLLMALNRFCYWALTPKACL